jgi:hypothetical protein
MRVTGRPRPRNDPVTAVGFEAKQFLAYGTSASLGCQRWMLNQLPPGPV